MNMGWENVANVKPEAEKNDGYSPFKANGLECRVNHARIEEYKGDKPELQGVQFFRYELEVVGGTTEFLGRRLWGSFRLDDDNKLKKVKNLFFTAIGVDLKAQEDLENNLAKFAEQNYVVRAWTWKPDDADEAIQQHAIKKPVTTGSPESGDGKPSF